MQEFFLYLTPGFPVILYVLCPLVSAIVLFVADRADVASLRSRKPFYYYYVYSTIGAITTPIILRTIDNKIFARIVGESEDLYLLASYVMIVSFFASSVLKKIASTALGENMAPEVKDFIQSAPIIVKNAVEGQATHVPTVDVVGLYGLLDKIESGVNFDSEKIKEYAEIIDLAKSKRLIKFSNDGSPTLTSLGRLYLSSK